MFERGPGSVWSKIYANLEQRGFEASGRRSSTGEFWRHTSSGRHIQVPFAIAGFFPEWLIWKFWAKVEEVSRAPPIHR